MEFKLPDEKPERLAVKDTSEVPRSVMGVYAAFEVAPADEKAARNAQGLFGYTSFDAVQFFDTIQFRTDKGQPPIPLMRYRLYQYVIAINHFKDELYICENKIAGMESDLLWWNH